MSNKVISFVDSVGRVIVGREVGEKTTEQKLAVSNPSVVNINVNQESGQISVQLLPYIFREFIAADKRFDKHVWFFNTNQITTAESFEIDPSVEQQYITIFETLPQETAPEAEVKDVEAEPVEMFDAKT
jgi:hypothetical protein